MYMLDLFSGIVLVLYICHDNTVTDNKLAVWTAVFVSNMAATDLECTCCGSTL
jgi:hypothetical protein